MRSGLFIGTVMAGLLVLTAGQAGAQVVNNSVTRGVSSAPGIAGVGRSQISSFNTRSAGVGDPTQMMQGSNLLNVNMRSGRQAGTRVNRSGGQRVKKMPATFNHLLQERNGSRRNRGGAFQVAPVGRMLAVEKRIGRMEPVYTPGHRAWGQRDDNGIGLTMTINVLQDMGVTQTMRGMQTGLSGRKGMGKDASGLSGRIGMNNRQGGLAQRSSLMRDRKSLSMGTSSITGQ